MGRSRHLVLALHDRSWGRAELARRIGRSLVMDGHDVRCLIHPSSDPLFRGGPIDYRSIGTGPSAGIERHLQEELEEFEPNTVIHSDVLSTANAFWKGGSRPPDFLLDDVESFTVDVWQTDMTGIEVDIVGDRTVLLTRSPGASELLAVHEGDHRLVPMPMGHPDGRGVRFRWLSSPGEGSGSRRSPSRAGRDRIILFCTGRWQTGTRADPALRRTVTAVSRLLGLYVQRLAGDAKLVHVGPEPLRMGTLIPRRYRWLPPVPPTRMDRLVRESRVLLSVNQMASTLARAMNFRVPVLAIQNSYRVETEGEMRRLVPWDLSTAAADILRRSLPLSPFRVWPVGYFEFLRPLVTENPFWNALEVRELLNEEGCVSALGRLLEDSEERRRQVERQSEYIDSLARLPSASEAIDASLANGR